MDSVYLEIRKPVTETSIQNRNTKKYLLKINANESQIIYKKTIENGKSKFLQCNKVASTHSKL